MNTCWVCEENDCSHGLLCKGCADAVPTAELCPEQIAASKTLRPAFDNLWLIDGFGAAHTVVVDHAHRATAFVVVGRAAGSDIAIAEATVSLRHAALEHRPKSGVWFVVDEDSENGTFVNGEPVTRRYPLEPGDRVSFGRRVSFYVVPLDASNLARAQRELESSARHRARIATRADSVEGAESRVRISAVTEGGAIAAAGAHRVQLSELEYELLLLLHSRHRDDDSAHEDVRGFVPSAQLLDALQFHSEAPVHNNLRVLVRKVRRKFAELDPPLDIIESRKGLGYRVARALDVG